MSFELVMPKMGESITEATILKWHKVEGDFVNVDEIILDIATDKVDSEIPSPFEGVITKILFKASETVKVGEVIALIESQNKSIEEKPSEVLEKKVEVLNITQDSQPREKFSGNGNRFYSPLVKKIVLEEKISNEELYQIKGSGNEGRITKNDIKNYISNKSREIKQPNNIIENSIKIEPQLNLDSNTEIIEMDRMRKLIADHMVKSKQISPHVTSFIECDVTSLVNWRNKNKDEFFKKYNEKITFTPFFIYAVVKAIKEFPMINVSVDGDKIIKKNSINIGMATALPTGNLIVPVIKNADSLNIIGITKSVNDFANRARSGKLLPEEIKDGTFTLTNVGTFGSVMGTPIINQPQVAILATGAIRKKPAVIESEDGDMIAIRHMMFLSLSYDHRVVDGFLGGSFLKKVSDLLEGFNGNEIL